MAKGIHFLNMSFKAHTFVPTQMLGLQYTSYNHFAVPRDIVVAGIYLSLLSKGQRVSPVTTGWLPHAEYCKR